MEQPQNESSTPPTGAQPAEPAPQQQSTPTQPPTAPKRQMPWLWIAIGAAAIIIVIIVLVVINGSRNPQSNNNQPAGLPTSFTVGSQPYLYGCSALTAADFKQTFGFSGPDTIGSASSTDALPEANTKNESDLLKNEGLRSTEGVESDCTVTVARSGQSGTVASFETQMREFADAQRATTYLDGQKRFAVPAGSQDTSALPKLPSFAQTSLLVMPSAQGASSTVKAIVAYKNVAITASYLMDKGETADAIVPKMDALLKSMTGNIDKGLAAKPFTLSGHATFIDKPYVDTCKSLGLRSVAEKLAINLRVDAINRTSQYGALPGSAAAGDGVVSSCSFNFNTAAEQKALDSQKTSSSSSKGISIDEVKKRYPHTLLLSTNTFANASAAMQAMAAKKLRQTKPGTTIEDVSGIGSGGYKLHKDTELPDFSITGNGKRMLVEDSYIAVTGNTMVTINLQQSKSDATQPLSLTEAQAKDLFKLFEAMLGSK